MYIDKGADGDLNIPQICPFPHKGGTEKDRYVEVPLQRVMRLSSH